MTNQPIDDIDTILPLTITHDQCAMIYNSCLTAFAHLFTDELITAITTDRDTARDFIQSLAYDPDASTETPADSLIAPYQLAIDFAYALENHDIYSDLCYALIDNDRLPSDFDPDALFLFN